MRTFNQFISESQEVLDKITTNWRRMHPGMKFHVTNSGNDIRVHSIEVPKEKRNQGIGTRAITGVQNYARSQGKRVTLTPAPDPRKKAKLNRFYKNLGFKPNSGRTKDFSVSDSRIWDPQA